MLGSSSIKLSVSHFFAGNHNFPCSEGKEAMAGFREQKTLQGFHREICWQCTVG